MYGGSRPSPHRAAGPHWNGSRLRCRNAEGLIDAELSCVDGTSIRAILRCGGRLEKKLVSGEPTDHTLGRSRGGFGTKLHLACDGLGVPLAAVVTAGQVHESTRFERLMGRARIRSGSRARPRCRPVRLAGARGYSYPRIRRWLACDTGIKAVVPRGVATSGRNDGRVRFDREAYQRRAVVGQCVGWPKERRAVATRFLAQYGPGPPRRFVLRSMVARAGRAAGLWC